MDACWYHVDDVLGYLGFDLGHCDVDPQELWQQD